MSEMKAALYARVSTADKDQNTEVQLSKLRGLLPGDEHPEREAHLASRGRSVKANWVEFFREYVEDIRRRRQV